MRSDAGVHYKVARPDGWMARMAAAIVAMVWTMASGWAASRSGTRSADLA